MMVKKTCKKRLTALINTDSRNSHASPDIIVTDFAGGAVRVRRSGYLSRGQLFGELSDKLLSARGQGSTGGIGG